MKNVKKLISEYLRDAKLMQVATVQNNKPWVATVWYVNDKDWNLYFISRRSRRHSQELQKNPNVAGTIVMPHVKGSGEKVRGLQFDGSAAEAKGDLLKKAKKLYGEKYPQAEDISLKKLQDPNFIATFYVIKPSTLILFDEINFPEDPRQELKL